MRTSSKLRVLVAALAVVTACGPRQVEVRTAPTTTTAGEQSVQVTNNLSQAVNVYVTATGSTEIFLRQVPANTVEKVPVPTVAAGTSATFKAVTVDGSRTYQSRTVAMAGLFIWSVP